MSIASQVEKKHTKLHSTRSGSIEYKAIYCLVFGSFLFVECLNSLGHKLIHPLTSMADLNRESPIVEARSAADSSVPYIFRM